MQSIEQNSSVRRRNKRKLNSEINVTPFVDVILVLLIIFMVTSPMLITGVEVNLPKTNASPLPGNDEPIVISVKTNGEIYLQETSIPLEQLLKKMKAIYDLNNNTRVFIKGDTDVRYGKIVQIFVLLKGSGYSNVALVTDMQNDNTL